MKNLLICALVLTPLAVQAGELDPSRPAHASREVCNAHDPLVLWDVVVSSGASETGCNSFTAADIEPGVKFMVVQGDHSLTVRYPAAHPPIVTGAYDRLADGVVQRCVSISMPDGLMLQRRAGTEPAVQDAQPHQVLSCSNSTRCTRAETGQCCCSSPSCDCFICMCTAGCADCTCDGEDGGIWSADRGTLHPYLHDAGWRRPVHGRATFEAAGPRSE